MSNKINRYQNGYNPIFTEIKINRIIAAYFHLDLLEIQGFHRQQRALNIQNPTRGILLAFLRILNIQLKKPLNIKDIKKIYKLDVYGEREIVRDWLVFLYYHSFNIKSYRKKSYNRLLIKPKRMLKIEGEILKKYDFKLPIIPSKTIASYLPDILMLADIPYPKMLYAINFHLPTHQLRQRLWLTHRISPVHLSESKRGNILKKLGLKNDAELLKRYLTDDTVDKLSFSSIS